MLGNKRSPETLAQMCLLQKPPREESNREQEEKDFQTAVKQLIWCLTTGDRKKTGRGERRERCEIQNEIKIKLFINYTTH